MNGSTMLELVFHEILGVMYPLLEDRTARESAIDQLQAVVATVRSLRGATVEPFGSFLSNLFTRWGDLDISVELSNGSYILSPGKRHKLRLLDDVFRALRTTGVRGLQLISDAKVPVVKFTTDQNIPCDISINNLSGHMKSKFLLWISDIDPRFRDMVLLVKEWAKAHRVNDPIAGTFNSYSLCLLVIFHFQTCKPAIFPPLKEIYPTNLGDELQGVRSILEERFQEVCTENINKFRRARKINRRSLSQLFVSFLAKYDSIEHTVGRESLRLQPPYFSESWVWSVAILISLRFANIYIGGIQGMMIMTMIPRKGEVARLQDMVTSVNV